MNPALWEPTGFRDAYPTALVQVSRLAQLREALETFAIAEPLNGFQRFILSDLYTLTVPALDFEAASILIVAVPHPMYASVSFSHGGQRVSCLSLTDPCIDAMETILLPQLSAAGYHAQAAPMLPLKRLAVQSGLAVYGRNNITYVEGFGSRISYQAYFTDIPCTGDAWRPMENAKQCAGCTHCLRQCPTGAIRQERFLIDNSICLSAINEDGGDAFPDWLDPAVHHTPYDCLRCQMGCPLNRGQETACTDSIAFDEAETGLLLSGEYDNLPSSLQAKCKALSLLEWADGLPRNLRALLAQTPA